MTGSDTPPTEIATLGAGCFWCVEAVLEQLDGVTGLSSGYMGGGIDNPTYQQVCSGTTGHAEVVQVTFDPARISFEQLLSWFFKLHDPTTLNRQGNDAGTQYRSAIFPQTPEQKLAAQRVIERVAASGKWRRPITTSIEPASTWYSAEKYHQDYLRKNPGGYTCHFMRD
jgi:methionine-S-sulfoxide reductase